MGRCSRAYSVPKVWPSPWLKEDTERAFLLERAELGPSTSAVDLTVPHRGQRRASAVDGSGGSLESALPGREEREMSGKGDLTGHQAVRRKTQTATMMV